MKCPNCGAEFGENNRFCLLCGSRLVPGKRGTHWIPLLILTVLALIGVGVYFAIPGTQESTAPESSAEAESESDTPWFTVHDGTLYFDAKRYDGSGELTVPEEIDGQTVTAIGDGCFEDCDQLITVILPDSVEFIGIGAFADCDYLRGIRLPDQTASIGTAAFDNCVRLEAIAIPSSVDYIGWDAFDDCDALRFVFFDGTSDEWGGLYTQQIGPDTCIYCSDGEYWQGDFRF